MSTQPITLTSERPIIQGLTPQPSPLSPRAVGRDALRTDPPVPAAATDTFESGQKHEVDGRHNAHLRRAAAQRQAARIAREHDGDSISEQKEPSEDSSTPTLTNLTPAPLTPTPGAPTPGVVTKTPSTSPANPTPVATVADPIPVAPQADQTSATTGPPDAQASPQAASRVFTRDDLAQINAIFGARVGDQRFNGSLDVNGDGVINGVDIATVLNGLTASPAANTPKTADSMTREELLDGLLKAFGKTVSAGDANSVYDLSGDGRIDGADLARALNRGEARPAEDGGNGPAASVRTIRHAFGAKTGDALFSQSLDLNGDGVIDGVDLARLLNGDG